MKNITLETLKTSMIEQINIICDKDIEYMENYSDDLFFDLLVKTAIYIKRNNKRISKQVKNTITKQKLNEQQKLEQAEKIAEKNSRTVGKWRSEKLIKYANDLENEIKQKITKLGPIVKKMIIDELKKYINDINNIDNDNIKILIDEIPDELFQSMFNAYSDKMLLLYKKICDKKKELDEFILEKSEIQF